MLKEFIDDVCSILGIEPPALSYDVGHYATDTMLAQCSPDGNTIFIRPYDNLNPDLFFAAAHELRHVWQIRTDYGRFMAEYRPVSLCSSIDEYNLQEAELDANAFAGAIMVDFFGVTPLFSNLSDNVRARTTRQMKEIMRST